MSFRSEEHTSELQSLTNLVCRLLLEKKKQQHYLRRTHFATTHPSTRLQRSRAVQHSRRHYSAVDPAQDANGEPRTPEGLYWPPDGLAGGRRPSHQARRRRRT